MTVALIGNMNVFSQGNDSYVDSLVCVQRNMAQDDTARMSILRKIISDHSNVDSANFYAKTLLDLSERYKSLDDKYAALIQLQRCNYFLGNYTLSLDYGYQGEHIADSLNDIGSSAYIETLLGSVYSMTLNATKADALFHKALEKYRQLGNSTMMVIVLSNIADSHSANSMYDEARGAYNEVLGIGESADNNFYKAVGFLGIGCIALEQYDNDKIVNPNEDLLTEAMKNLEEAYDCAIKALEKGDDDKLNVMEVRMQSATYLVSSILHDIEMHSLATSEVRNKIERCREILATEYRLATENGLDNLMTEADIVRTDFLVVSGQRREALALADSLHQVFSDDLDQYSEHMGLLYEEYTKIYNAIGRKDDALKSSEQARYWHLKKRSNTYAVTATQSIAQAQFDEQMRQREIEAKQNEVRLEEGKRRQTIISVASIIVLVLVSLLALAIAANYRRQKRNNLQLNLVNAELEIQKLEIESQSKIISRVNREMTDSVTYASNIQKAAMPTEEQLDAIVGDHMLFFRPLNIVSGDYYWASRAGNLRLLVVADCTGHGVPGAFVSLLGISILNEITAGLDTSVVSAAAILDNLRTNFKSMLKQHGNEGDNRDGMDLALVVIDPDHRQLHYAGAFRQLIMIHNGELSKIDADRMPIGSHLLDSQPFTDNVIDYVEGDLFYMFSDGITDQFGYNERGEVKKFTAKRLNSILSDIYTLPFSEQKNHIAEAVDNWRSGNGTKEPYEQTDDNIVFGIRV